MYHLFLCAMAIKWQITDDIVLISLEHYDFIGCDLSNMLGLLIVTNCAVDRRLLSLAAYIHPVSYTHLTLPTNREV